MKKITKYSGVAVALPLITLVGCGTQAKQEKPNVILIMTDDMGYSGITPFGGIGLQTPTLDRLAENGVVCTNFHTNAPVSSPTRVSIMTGSYQQRAGLNHIYSERDPMDGLDPATSPAFAQMLHDAGYRTGVFGKWHMGMDDKFSPLNHGFDKFVGFKKGNIDFASHINTTPELDWWHDREISNEEGYATDLINKYAVEFIRESGDQPFFMYIPQAAIHTPIQAPGDPAVRYGDTYVYDNGRSLSDEEYQRRYRGMIKAVDDGVQMLVDELEKEGKLDNTMIIFISDNGGEATAAAKYPGANGFFRGAKASLFEGGIRVPAIFYYPKAFKHRYSSELMLTMDLMPTILEFCGVENTRTIDGSTMIPTLTNGDPMPKRDVFWANWGAIAMQRGEWKYINVRGTEEIFNMIIDPKEEHNLSEYYPEKVEEMKKASDAWWVDVSKGNRLEGTIPTDGSNMMRMMAPAGAAPQQGTTPQGTPQQRP